MERKRFNSTFKNASDQLDKRKLKKLLKRNINIHDGFILNIEAMEEFSELSQQVSKSVRGMPDKTGMIEEMADSILAIATLKEMNDISTLELYKAINVKLDRLEYRLNKRGACS